MVVEQYILMLTWLSPTSRICHAAFHHGVCGRAASDRKWGLSDWLAFICVAALVLLLALQQDDEE